MCAWAVSALEAGFDTESLRVLASMSLEAMPNFFETKSYFAKALQELQLPVPSTREEALREYARSVAQDLVMGQMTVKNALNNIHCSVVSELDHPPDLQGWCYLWEGNSPDGSFAEMSEVELEQAACAFARAWLASTD